MPSHSATHPVKCIFGLVLFAILFVPNSFAQGSSSSMDEEEITVSVTLKRPPPSCNFVAGSLEYGTLRRPASGDGTALFDPVSGDFSYKDDSDNDLPLSGNQSISILSITATNTTRIGVHFFNLGTLRRRTCPTSETDSDENGKCWLPYETRVASSVRYSNDDPRSEWEEQPFNQDNFHPWDDATHAALEYRVGGKLTVKADTHPDDYVGIQPARITCYD